MPFDPPTVKALLFDLDGTLVDSTRDLVAAGNALRAGHGLPPLDAAVVASYIGDGVEALVRRLLGRPSGGVGEDVEAFMLRYREHCLDHTRFYAGVEPALRVLAASGKRMAVVTNKPEKVSRRILNGLGAGGLFGSVVGGDTCARKKPHADPLLKACADLGVRPDEALMVGDSRVDVEAGRAAGLGTVGVLGGIGEAAALRAAAPDVLIQGLQPLLTLMERTMDTGLTGKPQRTFNLRFTERIYRLHAGGIMNHAPRGGGVYELVEFPPDAQDGTVLYVGLVPQGGSIAEELRALIEGRSGLPAAVSRAVHERIADLYFDAVLTADCESELDWQDLAWALVKAKAPALNDPAAQAHSGRYGDIRTVDLGD